LFEDPAVAAAVIVSLAFGLRVSAADRPCSCCAWADRR